MGLNSRDAPRKLDWKIEQNFFAVVTRSRRQLPRQRFLLEHMGIEA
jgi:hypothetical protein